MINVTYYYSACVGIRAGSISVLCDPWFTDGAYDGAWYLFPPVRYPLDLVGQHDYIYISHIHPDHYDPKFLKAYLEHYPKTRVIIADFKHNYLSKRMKADGIAHTIETELNLDRTILNLLPHGTSPNDFDSVLVVRNGRHSVVNWNDNFYNADLIEQVLALTGPKPDIALLPYTGAGPFPQTYYEDKEELARKAQEQKEVFIARYFKLRNALNPKVAVPFAGQYVLGGKLYELNAYRGVSDATEVLAVDVNAVVLADGGKASIDTETLKPTAMRLLPYHKYAIKEYGVFLSANKMDYEIEFEKLDLSKVPFKRLLNAAYRTALPKSQQEKPYIIRVNYGNSFEEFHIGLTVDPICDRLDITIDPRYLYGLLTGVYHWNNAETGSQFTARRQGPYSRAAQDFLNFFHV